MGRMKDMLIAIEEDLMETMFPDKMMHELTNEEAAQLHGAAVQWWDERLRDAVDDLRERMKYEKVMHSLRHAKRD